MPKMEGNVKQSLEPAEIAKLPSFAKYLGNDPALAHLRGLAIPTRDVERLVYIGERENVWVDDGKGNSWQPWKGAWITTYDDDGNLVWHHEPLPKPQKNPMGRDDLAAVGMTDASLDAASQELLGERWKPRGTAASDARRAMYERVLRAMYAEPSAKK